ncbi:MAG: TetR/AcrR family transcriptional regulator [Actinomycetota bacterium]|nr:TetR/AcrR family transcriptional regulator [Actinomycetota bacterium]
MEAALSVIADRGLATTRISDIADRAGMSPGHVMYYFRSKDLVLMEALRYVEDRMHEEVATELASIAPGPLRLRRLLELNMPDGPADPGWALWLEAWTLASHDDDVRALVAELEARWVSLLTDVVRSGVEAKAFRCRDVAAAVTHIYATINGLAVQVVTGADGMTFARALEACLRAAETEFGAGGRR